MIIWTDFGSDQTDQVIRKSQKSKILKMCVGKKGSQNFDRIQSHRALRSFFQNTKWFCLQSQNTILNLPYL